LEWNNLQKTITKVALAYIFDAEDRVLIAKRPQSKHMGGFWEFPGGKLEPGESPLQAIQREILEELAIVVAGTAVLASFALRDGGELAFFPIVCQWLCGDIVLLEHDEYRFVALENLTHFDLAPADMIAAQRLINFLHAKPAK
jgi:8-oxo-dGTP diphosphatase